MKKNIYIRVLAYSLAGMLSTAALVGATPLVSFAQESETAITKTFTLDEIVCNTTLGSQVPTLGTIKNVSMDLTTDIKVYVSDLAPEYPGYHIQRATYKRGFSNYTGADYFFLKVGTNIKTKEPTYTPYIHYTGANGTNDLSTSCSDTRGTHLFVNYALNNYDVEYVADEDATNIPVDENVYTIESADSITVSDLVPVKEGFSFGGWTLEETQALYQPGDEIVLKDLSNEHVVLTAKFTEAPTATLTASTEVVNSWGDQVQLNITVTNTSDAPVKNWKTALSFEGTIDQIWNAELVEASEGHVVISHPSWKHDLDAGESYTFGIIATIPEDTDSQVKDITLLSKETPVEEVAFDVALNKQAWSYGYNGELVITNLSDESIDGWTLSFDYDDEITGIWNANIISHEGNHYVIDNAGYNGSIAPNSNITFGFSALPADGAEFSEAQLQNVELTNIR